MQACKTACTTTSGALAARLNDLEVDHPDRLAAAAAGSKYTGCGAVVTPRPLLAWRTNRALASIAVCRPD